MSPAEREIGVLGVLFFATLIGVLAAVVEMVRRPIGEDGRPIRRPKRERPRASRFRHTEAKRTRAT